MYGQLEIRINYIWTNKLKVLYEEFLYFIYSCLFENKSRRKNLQTQNPEINEIFFNDWSAKYK